MGRGRGLLLADMPVEVLLDNVLPFVSALGLLHLGCTNKVWTAADSGFSQLTIFVFFPSFFLHYAMTILFGNANCSMILISREKVPLAQAATS
jgi:hypothetical protein